MKIDNTLTDASVLRELGERLLKVRLDRNLTQAALAEQAGISKRTVERIESGEVASQLSGFVRICRGQPNSAIKTTESQAQASFSQTIRTSCV
jgi:transcriptional regulator with XRE-family HTH domain